MNLSGNVVNLMNIFNAIVAADETCDLSTVYFNSGRIFRILLFEIKEIELEEASL